MKAAMTPTRWGMAAALLAAGLLVWWQWDEAATEEQRLAAEQAKEAAAALAASQAGDPAYGLRDLFGAVDRPLPRGPAASGAPSSSSNPWQLAQASTAMAEAGGSAPPDLSPEDKAVNEQLRRLGYQIDERYYQMPLAQLRQAAAAKDVQALTHLARTLSVCPRRQAARGRA